MTVLGIAYLLAAGAMLGVLTARDRHFHQTGATVVGTISDVPPRHSGDHLWRRLLASREGQLATVTYERDGKQASTLVNLPPRVSHRTGDRVNLVVDRGDTAADDVVAVRGSGLRGLGAMAMLYTMAGVVVALVAGFRLFRGSRTSGSERSGQRSVRQAPREEVGEITGVPVAPAAVDDEHGLAGFEADPADAVQK